MHVEAQHLVEVVAAAFHPLADFADLDPIIHRVGESRVVLLGEASHGTSEFYTWRARLTKRLIQEKGFSFVAVEGDWPDCYSINRYVKRYPGAGYSALSTVYAFRRWPTWMWANWEVVAFCEWLRRHNEGRANDEKVGFYGLDVYSLWDSLREVTRYLERSLPEAVEAARQAYACFQPYAREAEAYAWASRFVPHSCEEEVIALLTEARRQIQEHQTVLRDREAAFNAEQNALVVAHAEEYYRHLIQGGAVTWNIRDRHMAEPLDRLLAHHGPDAKAIVWEHNTHIGDARATDMAQAGMVNVGQLAREQWGSDAVLVGFGSYRGNVIAAPRWDGPMQQMYVPAARHESWEALFHRSLRSDGLIVFDAPHVPTEVFEAVRPHRAIGVVYDPQNERGNYVPTSLARRYDCFIHIEESQALHPVHVQPAEDIHPPETYPWAV